MSELKPTEKGYIEALAKKDCTDGQREVKQGELKCANCGTPYLHGQK